MNLLIYPAAFLCVFLGCLGFYFALTKEKRGMDERLRKYTQKTAADSPEYRRETKKERASLITVMGKAGGIFVKKGMTAEIEKQLARADIPLRGEEYLIIWFSLVFAPGILVFLLTNRLIPTACLFLLGVIIPPLMVNQAVQKRVKKFNLQLKDSLAIMSNALRAGFSFVQAMELVSREMTDPIAKEFTRTYREMNLGSSLEEALQNLVKRVASEDLDLLVTAVLIQRQVGGNLAEILDNISFTIRERIRIQGEIKTLTAQGRISGYIIGLIPPILAVLLLMINPDYMGPLFHSPIGFALLGAAAVSQIVGIALIRKIVTIDI